MTIINIKADLHTHTISSGHAYSTITELAQAAFEKGIKLIAMTDHGPNLPGGPHEYHFGNIAAVPDIINGVKILKGVEANILDNGHLDLPESKLKALDFVAAGLHGDTGITLKTEEEYTEATIKAMENIHLNMITHPANLGYPVNIKKMVKAARKNNVILEINASLESLR